MTFACVSNNILDMRSEPNHHAERVNQLLFGEIVRIQDRKNGFAAVERWDTYHGWADDRFLTPISKAQVKTFQALPTAVITGLQVRIFDSRGKTIPPHVIFYGTRLALHKKAGGETQLGLPDGRKLFVKASKIHPITHNRPRTVTGPDLVREAGKFLGIPYLWGGISPLGLDCSGLVQTICRRFDISMPRDSKDQAQMGVSVDRACIKTGDLLFFPGHVAIALGQQRIIHSSRGGGGVRIETLTPGTAQYRSDLDSTFKQARRIL